MIMVLMQTLGPNGTAVPQGVPANRRALAANPRHT